MESSSASARLEPGSPNPFSQRTTLRYTLPAPAQVVLTVTDAVGREVRRLVSQSVGAGSHVVPFDAEGLASGVYFVRLEVGGALSAVQRVSIVR